MNAEPKSHTDNVDDATHLWDDLEAGNLGIIAVFDSVLNQEAGIGYLWFRALDALSRSNGGLRLQDLAEKVYHSQSGTTRLVDRLVKAGFVERRQCTADRRVIYAALTKHGIRQHLQARKIWQSLLTRNFWNSLEPAERSLLQTVSLKLQKAGQKPHCPNESG